MDEKISKIVDDILFHALQLCLKLDTDLQIKDVQVLRLTAQMIRLANQAVDFANSHKDLRFGEVTEKDTKRIDDELTFILKKFRELKKIIIEKYKEKTNLITEFENRIIYFIDLNEKLDIKLKGMISNTEKNEGVSSLKIKHQIGESAVYLHIVDSVNLSKIEFETPNNNLMNIHDYAVYRSGFNARSNELKKKSIKDLSKEFLMMFAKTVFAILESEPILKVAHTNIYIKIVNTEEYDGKHMPFGNAENIFLYIVIKPEMIEDYANGYAIFSHSRHTFMTIRHELTHAFDLKYQTVEFSKLIKKLSDEKISIPFEPFYMMLRNLRAEGVAILSEYINAGIFQGIIEYSNRLFSEDIQRESDIIKGVFVECCTSNDSRKYVNQINLVYGEYHFHKFGSYMAFIIFLNELKNIIKIFHRLQNGSISQKYVAYNNLQNLRPSIEQIASQNNWMTMNHNDVSLFLKRKLNLNYIIEKKDFEKVLQFMNKLSITDEVLFWEKYLDACKALDLDSGFLSMNNLHKYSEYYKKTQEKLVHDLGF